MSLCSVQNFASILQRCVMERNHHQAWCFHVYMRKCGLESHKLLGNYLISAFLEVGKMDYADMILGKLLCEDDYFCWSTLIISYIRCRNFENAYRLYEKMHVADSPCLNGHGYVALMKACADLKNLEIGCRLHAEVARVGLLQQNLFVGTAIMTMYIKCGSPEKAQEVFDMLPNQDIASWNVLLAGYVEFGDGRQALNCFEKMQIEGVLPSPITVVCILKACGIVGAIEKGHEIHMRITNNGDLSKNTIVGNALVDMYAKCGFLRKALQSFEMLPVHDLISWNILIAAFSSHGFLLKAQKLFDRLFSRDIVSWNALIMGYAENDHSEEAWKCYERMLQDGISPNSSTFVSILKACSSLGIEDKGREVHAEILKTRHLEKDLAVGRSVIDMYAKCGAFNEAHQVYYMLQLQDDVSLTSLIAGYAKRGLFSQALQTFSKLAIQGVVAWNTLISGYVEHGNNEEALDCFDKMQEQTVQPNVVTFVCSLKACSSIGIIDRGQEIHAELARNGWLGKDISIGNVLIDMYAKCGWLGRALELLQGLPFPDLISWNALMAGYAQYGFVAEAQEVFDRLKVRDVISWNTLIMSYVECGQAEKAIKYFEKMLLEGVMPDVATFVSCLKACSYVGDLSKGLEIYDIIMKVDFSRNNLSICNTLIDMFAKCGSLPKAKKVFNDIPVRNVVSWNAIIAGYTEYEQNEEALEHFEMMQHEGVSADVVTYIYCLKVCNNMGAVDKALDFHGQIIQKGFFEREIFIGNTLIDFYVKNSMSVEAQNVFDQLPSSDVVSWNALISRYSLVGLANDVLPKMIEKGIKPTLVTFANILKACCHKGLFDEAVMCFEAMNEAYNIIPSSEHQNCMVDILGRAGHLDKAIGMVNECQHHGNLVIWHAILDACRRWGNLDAAKYAFHYALQTDTTDPGTYLLMSHIYASANHVLDEEA